MERLYLLRDRPLTNWGDYGDILVHGMTMHAGRIAGMLQLERTAPFIPPISVYTHVVVTGETKRRLQSSGLTGLAFRPVVKAHIVHLPWEEWDRTLDEPPVFPESGEPEDYILGQPHDPRAADALGDVHELVVAESARMELIDDPNESMGYAKKLILESWDGNDFFGADGVMYTYVSDKAKRWLEEVFPKYLSFERA